MMWQKFSHELHGAAEEVVSHSTHTLCHVKCCSSRRGHHHNTSTYICVLNMYHTIYINKVLKQVLETNALTFKIWFFFIY